MNPERWERIGDLFDAASALDVGSRESYLRDACDGDDALYEEVQSLLEADGNSHSLLEGVALDALSILEEFSYEGRTIGPYRVLREIGRGGMGAVLLAERADGAYEQQVALKLIKRGMDSDLILRRFRIERQILARLQHPNIARLLDGGMTEDGQPYVVMEYIDGQPIDEYCDTMRLSVEERLALFTTVCKAVHFAHQNLVVHRDLKPDNILVTPSGQVKLLDFGIAKVLDAEDEGTGLTQVGSRVMTPEYASPEQVRGEPVNTSTDIYSLGVVLYELLAGQRPYQIRQRTPVEVARVVCETEPERPSTMLGRTKTRTGAVGETRKMPLERLRRRLSGDLDTICLKAIKKEAERRYASAEAFMEDIRRHLEGLPVLARPDRAGYRLLKFVQRHRISVLATLAVVALFLALTGLYTRRLALERDRARVEAEKAQQVAAFLEDVFAGSDPEEARGATITAKELLDEGAASIQETLDDQPEVQAALMRVIGNVYLGLGLFDEARPMLESALHLHRRLFRTPSAEVATSETAYAVLLQDLGDVESAEPLFRQALETRRALFGAQDPAVTESMRNLAFLLETRGDYAAAESLYTEALAVDRTLYAPDDPKLAKSMADLAVLLRQLERYDRAEQLLRDALVIQSRPDGSEDLNKASTMRNLASLLRDKGSYEEAEKLYRESLAIRRSMLGAYHPEVANTLNSLAILMDRKGDREGAIEATRTFVTILDSIHAGHPHPSQATAYSNLAFMMRDQGRMDEAARLFRQSIAVQDQVLEQDHPNRAFPLIGLASVFMEQARFREAEPLFRRALALREAALPEDHRYVADARSDLGDCLRAMNRYEEAESLLLKSYETLDETRGQEDGRTQRALRRLVHLYDAWGRSGEAESYRHLIASD